MARQKPALVRDVATGDIVSLKWFEEAASTLEWLALYREWVSVDAFATNQFGSPIGQEFTPVQNTEIAFSRIVYDAKNLLNGAGAAFRVDLRRWTHGLYLFNVMVPTSGSITEDERVALDLYMRIGDYTEPLATQEVPWTEYVVSPQMHVSALLDIGRVLRDWNVYEFEIHARVYSTEPAVAITTTSGDYLSYSTMSALCLFPTAKGVSQRYTVRDAIYGTGSSTWTAPVNWASGVPTVAKGNEIAEAIRFAAHDRPYCGLISTVTKSLANNTFDQLGAGADGMWPTAAEVYDPRDLHSTVTNPQRITVGTTGLWLVWCSVYFPAQLAGGNIVTTTYIRRNGVNIATSQVVAYGWFRQAHEVGTLVNCSATSDYFDVTVYHTYGTTQTVGAGTAWWFGKAQFHAALMTTGTAAGDTWTAPHTLDINETYHTTQHNRLAGDVRWFMQDRDAWILRNDSATSGTANNATFTSISWATEDLDRTGLHTASSNTVTIATTGVYLIGGCLQFQSLLPGSFTVRIRKNGTTTIAMKSVHNIGTAGYPILTMSPTPVYLTAGDTLIMQGVQLTGANVTLGDATDTTGWSAKFWGLLERRG